MDFFPQAWAGIRKELSVYRSNPKIFLGKLASVFIFTLLTVVFGKTNSSNLKGAVVLNAIFHIELYFLPIRALLLKVSTERAENLKEYFMINGMTKAAYQAKIAVANYLDIIFFALPQSFGLYLTYRQYFESFWVTLQIFITLFVGGFATVNMALMAATFLSPQTSQNIGSVLLLLLGFLYFGATSLKALVGYIIVSCNPSSAMALAINVLLPADQTQIDWDGYTNPLGIGMMFISGVCFLGIYLYREKERDVDLKDPKTMRMTIVGNPTDKASLTKIINRSDDLEQPAMSCYNSALHFESLPEHFNLVKTIEAVELKKVFDGNVAVDGISFSIFEEEIFCLLGHNGAGKSTLVNMLTGLIPKTEGVLVYNGTVVYNVEKIRGQIGFCPQKDFVLLENTVYENLSFFAEIKKVPKEEMEAEIERVMNKLGLTQHKNMAAGKLSGGFKRKLNIAIALLKDPKIIIMDEPTSGMDPVSRRNLWAIIKGLKEEGKTVLLTTQFLDEAEELADRIAIMTKGKFLALGRCEYIKKEFGAGYKLIIHNKDYDTDIQLRRLEIASKIQSIIPSATQNYDTAPNVVQFTLPLSHQNKFSQLFSELESMEDLQLSLQESSLEETFVSLGINSDQGINEPDSPGTPSLDNGSISEEVPSSFSRSRR